MRKHRKRAASALCVVAVMAMAMAGCETAVTSEPPGTYIVGQTMTDDEVPVPGAILRIEDQGVSTMSDATGFYQLEVDGAGCYPIVLEYDNHARARVTVGTVEGKVSRVNFRKYPGNWVAVRLVEPPGVLVC